MNDNDPIWTPRQNCPADLMQDGRIIATFYPELNGKGDVIMDSIPKAHDRCRLASAAPRMASALLEIMYRLDNDEPIPTKLKDEARDILCGVAQVQA